MSVLRRHANLRDDEEVLLMTHLFLDEPFTSHSGLALPFKIDADALTDGDLATVARVVAGRFTFGTVHGIPRGGMRLARALTAHITDCARVPNHLIVDDVLTTGSSMEQLKGIVTRDDPALRVFGLVLFARGPCPSWVTPFFTLHEAWR